MKYGYCKSKKKLYKAKLGLLSIIYVRNNCDFFSYRNEA